MSRKLTISEVISDLREVGYKVEPHPTRANCYYCYWNEKSEHLVDTERQLYKTHKWQFEKGRSYKKIVKRLSNGKDRAAQRDAIKTEKFDDIPSNKRVKEQDPWAFD